MSIVTAGLFLRSEQATNAINALERVGFKDSELSLICDQKTSLNDADHQKVRDAIFDVAPDETPSVGMGMGIGAVSGATLGILSAAGVLAAPFALPVVVFGALGGTAAAALWGGTLGGLITWLTKEGVPSELGNKYVEAVNNGQALVIVRLDDGQSLRAQKAEIVMMENGMLPKLV